MNSKITADEHKLMQDGADTAHYYMHKAIESIDDKFGEGYAKEHPELIGAFMQTAATDYQGTIIAKYLAEKTEDPF